MPPPDYTSLAEKVVGTSANVKEGEVVAISGGLLDMPLLEDIAIAVRKRGAFPLLIVSTDKIAKAENTTVPEKYDGQTPKLGVALARTVDVYISIPAVRDPGIPAMLAPERAAKRAKAQTVVDELRNNRHARIVELDNGLAPSWTRANSLGIAEAELARIFWDALNTDYTAIETRCKSLQNTIAAGNELAITHSNGSALKLKIKNRTISANDGVTTAADLKVGGPSLHVRLPAGDVYLTPVPGTAQGTIIDDRMIYLGKEITGVTVDIAKGRTTAVTAESGWDAVKARYSAAGPGKTEVSYIDIGCNPSIKSSGKFETSMGAGTVTIGFGGNVWAGGTNKEPFGLALQLSDATVTLDGKTIIEKGQLKYSGREKARDDRGAPSRRLRRYRRPRSAQ